MRDRATLHCIYARVLEEWVTNRVPSGPLLTERYAEPRARVTTCRRGHDDYGWRGGKWTCLECDRERKRVRR